MEDQIVVSILCTAYNHEPYIRQCLDGFVMQKTNFKFEAIVHDDASTDNTASVIREYAEKYPDIIVPIYQTENQYRKTNIYSTYLYPKAKGKYIAICEGDDYWIDPYKLQKQVDFLDANPEYSMCFANAIEHWEDGEKEDKCFSNVEDRDYTGVEIYENWIVPTASVLYRKEIAFSDRFKEVTSNKNFIFGDIVWFLICAEFGKLRGMSDVVSVYRRHNNGLTSKKNQSLERSIKFAYHQRELGLVFGKDKTILDVSKRNTCSLFVHMFFKYMQKNGLFFLRESLSISYSYTIKYLLRYLLKGFNKICNKLKSIIVNNVKC